MTTAASICERSVIGHSMRGKPIECLAFGDGPDVVMFIGAIHGNERAGTFLLQSFCEFLEKNPGEINGKRIIVLPIANPDGYDDFRRYNKRGVDLNRNFPANNRNNGFRLGRRALSEPESQALFDLVNREKPTRIVSLHQPVNCIDYDGPGQAMAEAMAAVCDLPVRKLGARPGSMGSYIEQEHGIIFVTPEFSGNAHCRGPEQLWKDYGEMILVALRWNQK